MSKSGAQRFRAMLKGDFLIDALVAPKFDGNYTLHLQGIGKVKAKPVRALAVGDVILWNYGSRSRVEAIAPVGKRSSSVTMLNKSDGLTYTKRMIHSRLVGISSRAWEESAARQPQGVE